MAIQKDNITNDYIQFSKRVTRWGMILVSAVFVLCLIAVTFFVSQPEITSTIASIYTAYVTVMGITIGAYQGNSTLEKWSKAKYEYKEATDSTKESE